MSEESDRVRRHFVAHGRVQGVFYRRFVMTTARGLGLVGWVRNLPDGTVEGVAEGPPEALDELAIALREGPQRADVTALDVTTLDSSSDGSDERFDSFSKR